MILESGNLEETYHLIDEYKNPGLGMLGALWIAIYCDPKSRIEVVLNAINDGNSSSSSGFLLLRVKQEYVCTRKCRYFFEVIDNACFDCIRVVINDQVRVDVNDCTSLDEKLAQPSLRTIIPSETLLVQSVSRSGFWRASYEPYPHHQTRTHS